MVEAIRKGTGGSNSADGVDGTYMADVLSVKPLTIKMHNTTITKNLYINPALMLNASDSGEDIKKPFITPFEPQEAYEFLKEFHEKYVLKKGDTVVVHITGSSFYIAGKAVKAWAGWDWLKANVPVMCNWDGGIDYFLDPDDYTKKADGTNSDAANIDYAGDAMAIVKKIYKKEYKVGNDRYVYFCERKVDDDFHAVGFNVLGKERDYMLIPMFYGSIDSNGKMRSIAGQWSCLTASGSAADSANGKAIGTAEQYTAIQAASGKALFFGGALTNTLADICILLSKSTDSQTAFGSGMCSTYVEDKAQHYGTKINTVIGGGQFYGSNDNKSFNKIFHSCVMGSYMLWQRDPYMLLINGRIKVSPDYTYDLTGAKYLDTGVNLAKNGYYATTQVVKDFGAVPNDEIACSSATGYCDHTWVNAEIPAVSLRFGGCDHGAHDGLWARTLGGVAANAWWSCGASKLLPAPAAA